MEIIEALGIKISGEFSRARSIRIFRRRRERTMMGFKSNGFITIFFFMIMLSAGHCFSENTSYDPLLISGITKIEIVDTLLKDNDRDREIPIRFFLPTARKPAEVVLFSHGLGGSSKMNAARE